MSLLGGGEREQRFLVIIKPCRKKNNLLMLEQSFTLDSHVNFIYIQLKREQTDLKANTCILVFVKFERNLLLSNLDRSRRVNIVSFIG